MRKILQLIKKLRLIIALMLNNRVDIDELLYFLEEIEETSIIIFHVFSFSIIADEELVKLLIKKLPYVKENICICGGNDAKVVTAFIVKNKSDYVKLLKENLEQIYLKSNFGEGPDGFSFMGFEGWKSILKYNDFLNYISGGFDSRFFISLTGDTLTVRKYSNKQEKIEAEYKFWYLLPDEMKKWFVMPYNFIEDSGLFSYDMERYHMPDLAIRYVHGAISIEEFREILEKTFCFIENRAAEKVTFHEWNGLRNRLYLEKVESRLLLLEQDYKADYDKFNSLISMGTKYRDILHIFEEYQKVYQKISPGDKALNVSVDWTR